MRVSTALAALLALLTGSHPPPAAADEPKATRPKLPVKLGTIPDVKLTPRPAPDDAQLKRIKGLIADLAQLDGADVSLSATVSGDAFAPVPGQSHVGTLQLTDHRLKPSETLRELVALGPVALPLLLDAIDDKTPTKLTITHDGRLGAMWYVGELDLNPVNPAEAATYKERAAAARRTSLFEGRELTDSHTVTVGDACFVAIGQITGRRYRAVRYQPSANIVINSPTHDPRLRAAVRAAWASKDPVRKLFDSLLADYATEGIFNGTSLDGWSFGSEFQCGAALRLLYYFPKESAPLVAGRLDKLGVGRGEYIPRAVANRVRSEQFVNAVAWCREPAVRASVAGVFKRADDFSSLMAALPGVEDTTLIRGRLEPLVDQLPPADDAVGSLLLRALAERTPDTAEAVFRKYLRTPHLERHRAACWALSGVTVPWDAAILGPLLDDKRETDDTYAANPGGSGPKLRIRICDEAATTLADNYTDLKFTLAGEHADLDRQIAVMRQQLNRKR
jgi:hypothetical protein